MNSWRMIATALVAVGCIASIGATGGRSEERKDWFGRPLQACEPKCHWQWWLGRKAAPNEAQPATAPHPAPAAEAAVEDRGTAEARDRRRTRAARSAKRVMRKVVPAPRTAASDAWPAEPADLLALAMMGAASPEPAAGEPVRSGPIASSFGAMALLVVRRDAVFEAPSGGLVASDAQAAALGDLGPQLAVRDMPLSDAVLDRADGLAQVASGELRGFLIGRPGSRQRLTAALAEHPELMALPLARPAPEPMSVASQAAPSPAPDETAFAPAAVDGDTITPSEPATKIDGPVAQAFAATASADGASETR